MASQTNGMAAQGAHLVVKVATLANASRAMHGIALPIKHFLIHHLHCFATHLSTTCMLCAKHEPTINNSVFSMQSDLEQCLGTILDSVLSK